MRFGRKKKKDSQAEVQVSNDDVLFQETLPKHWCVPLLASEAGTPARGDAFIGTGAQGEVAIVCFDLPEPWQAFESVYTSYAAFLEQPGSGDRVRIDMIRASEANWAAVKAVGKLLGTYSAVYICPVADGLCGSSILTGRRS